MRTSTAFVVVSHDVKQPSSFPRRMSAPGVCNFASLTPNRGVGGAPRDVRVLGGTPVGRAHDAARQALARRLASHNAGRSPLGAPPWRFFTRGRASFSGIASGSVERAPRSQVVVPGGRLPGPPGANGYKPPPQDATPRSAFRIVSRRRPSMSEAGEAYSVASYRSQLINSLRSRKCSQMLAAAVEKGRGFEPECMDIRDEDQQPSQLLAPCTMPNSDACLMELMVSPPAFASPIISL